MLHGRTTVGRLGVGGRKPCSKRNGAHSVHCRWWVLLQAAMRCQLPSWSLRGVGEELLWLWHGIIILRLFTMYKDLFHHRRRRRRWQCQWIIAELSSAAGAAGWLAVFRPWRRTAQHTTNSLSLSLSLSITRSLTHDCILLRHQQQQLRPCNDWIIWFSTANENEIKNATGMNGWMDRSSSSSSSSKSIVSSRAITINTWKWYNAVQCVILVEFDRLLLRCIY